MLDLFAIPVLSDNYVWVLHDRRNAIIVDPGDAAPICKVLDRTNLRPAAILLTHHHADHVAGTSQLVARYAVPVYGPVDSRVPFITLPVGEGDCIALDAPAVTLTVLEIPGHTRTHIAYHGHDILFCGDTLFSVGCGRLFEGTAEQLLHSLDKLSTLSSATRICCGHEYTLSNCRFAFTIEPNNSSLGKRYAEASILREQQLPTLPSSLAQERTTNPFLRIDVPAVAAEIDRQSAGHTHDRLSRFAYLRKQKDEFH